MPARQVPLVPNVHYHIFNRVSEGKFLFVTSANYLYCIQLLKKYALKYSVQIVAYCLMPNHYHFLIKQCGNLSLSKFIGDVFNAYVQAFNKQEKRKGPLFEDRFKSIPVEKEEYLLHLCRYTHLNPVKADLAAKPEEWAFSDYKKWIGIEKGDLKHHEFVLEHFKEQSTYERFVSEYQEDRMGEKKFEKYYLE
jgi:REP element-mobilizing transposase RayT